MDSSIDGTTSDAAIDNAFLADRMAFWSRFTSFVTGGAAGVAVLLVLLWFFLA